ncbi:MAG: ABC transporter ATP-binding protein [Prevotella sp.]|nr:ABC transporter ATP-binding protein [Prevotella sp.]
MRLTDVSIGYGKHVIASGISFSLHAGRLACLIGRNGCGKSTLLRTIAGLQKPLSGAITYHDCDLATIEKKHLARTVSIVLTRRVDVPDLTVEQLVAAGRTPYTDFFGTLTEEDRAVVNSALSAAGILELTFRPVQTLSDGEYQKAIIAKTLAQQTPVILLDEPTAFLDYQGKAELTGTIKRLCRSERKTAFMSTHDVNLAMHMADDIFLMADGKVRQCTDDEDLRRFVGSRAAAFL